MFSDLKKLIIYQEHRYNQLLIIYTDENFDQLDTFSLNHTKNICDFDVLESKHLVATSGKDRLVKIWDLEQKKCIESFQVLDYAEFLSMPNSNLLIGWQGNPNLWVWSLKEHKFLFQNNTLHPNVVKLNRNNNNLLIGTIKGDLECYSLEQNEKKWSCKISL